MNKRGVSPLRKSRTVPGQGRAIAVPRWPLPRHVALRGIRPRPLSGARCASPAWLWTQLTGPKAVIKVASK